MSELTIQKTNEIKTLPFIIRQLIEQRLLDCHFCLPGKVEKYNRKKRKADIKPLLKKKDNTQSRSLPVIPNVPVCMYSSNNNTSFIDFPVKKGDTGIILFSERSLDLWLVQGGEIDPNDPRKFDLSDGIFIPGLNPFNIEMDVVDNDDLIITNNKSRIVLKNNGDIDLLDNTNNSKIKMVGGKFKIENTANELIDVCLQLCTAVEAITVATSIGIQPIINKATVTALKTKFSSLKG